MRIGWATPFNVRSAIGRFSQIVCEELQARGHEVAIIRIESRAERALDPIDTYIDIIDADDFAADDYDLLVANFGNHAPYHAKVVGLLTQRAPLAIFHDMEMRDFEWGLINRHGLHFPRLNGIGPEIGASRHTDMVDPEARALLATLASMACGAVVHGPHYLETVSNYCPGSVAVIPLCYPDTGVEGAARPLKPGRRVTIFGVISHYKQPERVLEAMALVTKSVGPIELHLAGSVEPNVRDALSATANRLGLTRPVFHGYVSDERLQDIIEDSQVVCCLRYPVTEGGSASLVTALYRARPLIISNIASYSMVPDALAYKVSYGEDPNDVAAALREIFTQPDEAEQRAAKAREWATGRFSAPTYVDALEPLFDEAKKRETFIVCARSLVPAVTTPSQEPVIVAVEAFSEVLDWMQSSQQLSISPISLDRTRA